MNHQLAHINRYLCYLKRSVNRHGVHSPFVYSLIEEVFKDKTKPFPDLEKVRHELLKDDTPLQIQDLGAGSSTGAGAERSVAQVAKASLSTAKQCRLLARIIPHLGIKHVLEFGSCLGLSAAYMSAAGAQVVSMEGSEALHALAQQHFGAAPSGPDFRLGPFDELLPDILGEIPKVDMAFIDGNHTQEATLLYFHQILAHTHSDSVLIFDDIHWSEGMENAWSEIQGHKQVVLSLDLWWCGIVFFQPGLSGEHFTLRY